MGTGGIGVLVEPATQLADEAALAQPGLAGDQDDPTGAADDAAECVLPGGQLAVAAHELGHVHGNDIRRGLIFVAIVTPLSLIFVSVMAGALARRRGIEPGQPAYLPAFALAIALVSLVIGVPGNQLSRAVEARADTFSLELTNDPKGMIGLQQQLADRNLGDPDPPELYTFVFGTHPPTIDRIGAALAWQQGERP